MRNIQLNNIHYCVWTGAFQARVDIQQGDKTQHIPCQVIGPKTMQMEAVCQSLSQQALWMCGTPR